MDRWILVMRGVGRPDTTIMTPTTEPIAESTPGQANSLHAEPTIDDTVVAEDVTRYVVVEINKNKYGISTDATVELMDSGSVQITRVSHAPGYVKGVINHRGTIIPAIDTRSLLHFKSHEAEVQELEDMLALREKDHVAWLTELKLCVDTGDPFTKATDPTKCAFGKWYDGLQADPARLDALTKGDTALKAIVEQFDVPHKRIHGIAKQVLDLAEKKETAHAKQIIEEAWTGDLARMRHLFKTLVETVKATHTSMMIISEHEGKKIGLIVDEVHSVFDCPDDGIDPLPDSSENAEFLKGLVHQPDGSYILIADIEYIYEQTCPE